MIRRLIAALLCRWDIHDLLPGFRRIDPDQWRSDVAVWLASCPWCRARFVVVAEHPSPTTLTTAIIRGRLS